AVSVNYTYRFMRKISAIGSYSNLLTTTGGASSIVSGFDVGAQYCFMSCAMEKQTLSDVTTLTYWSPFGVQVGGGFAQRSIQLSNATVAFSGPFGRVEGSYMISERFKVLVSAQYNMLANADRTVTQMTFLAGVGFDFGGEAPKKSSIPEPKEE